MSLVSVFRCSCFRCLLLWVSSSTIVLFLLGDVRNIICTLDDDDDDDDDDEDMLSSSLRDDVIVVDNQQLTASPTRRVFDFSRLGMPPSVSLCISVCLCLMVVCVCVCICVHLGMPPSVSLSVCVWWLYVSLYVSLLRWLLEIISPKLETLPDAEGEG